MATCKKKFLNIILSLFSILIFTNFSYGRQTFKQLENKKVSYLDFFLLKFENTITKRAQILRRQMFVNVTILHPIKKRELSCYGKVNDYELKWTSQERSMAYGLSFSSDIILRVL